MTIKSSRSILMIAYHMPPIAESSGVHRSLAFADYLARQLWNVHVLTVSENALPNSDSAQARAFPTGIQVTRALAFDSRRVFGIRGRYPNFLAIPDRFQSWIISGYLAGRKIIKQMKNPVIWSTSPIASAHVIGMLLSRDTGCPWFVDFRDPMFAPGENHRYIASLERRILSQATAVSVTTPSTRNLLHERIGHDRKTNIEIIQNGFDDLAWEIAQSQEKRHASHLPRQGPYTIVHCGSVYGEYRSPASLFKALGYLRERQHLSESDVCFVFRGVKDVHGLSSLAESLGAGPFVRVLPTTSHENALREMAEADALLLLQGTPFNSQIPAKVYEYLAMRRPILALTNDEGDTAKLLRDLGFTSISPLDHTPSIAKTLVAFTERLDDGNFTLPTKAEVRIFHRRYGAENLNRLLLDISAST